MRGRSYYFRNKPTQVQKRNRHHQEQQNAESGIAAIESENQIVFCTDKKNQRKLRQENRQASE